MGFADHYFRNQGNIPYYIPNPPCEELRYIVVIPAFNETGLVATLNALYHCSRPKWHVEIIVVVNFPENTSESVIRSSYDLAEEVKNWIKAHPDPVIRVMLMEAFHLPARHAGAGLARKTGMDEAAWRFNRIGRPDGLIISFDADCLCDPNYFVAIEEYAGKYPAATGFNIYFEHPVAGEEYSDHVYKGIIKYELHLRYVIQFLRSVGFPFAYHTVGSAFAVRAGIYTGQGGMNKRKAGEDFYFLHKIIPLGNFHEINTTRVIPSPRPSERSPFGTGAAISKYLSTPEHDLVTYAPDSFLLLRDFFKLTKQFYKIPQSGIAGILEKLQESMQPYLNSIKAAKAIDEINNNCRTVESFVHRFFRWFDAFMVIKFLNYANRSGNSYTNVRDAVRVLLQLAGRETTIEISDLELLDLMRKANKGQLLINLPQQ